MFNKAMYPMRATMVGLLEYGMHAFMFLALFGDISCRLVGGLTYAHF